MRKLDFLSQPLHFKSARISIKMAQQMALINMQSLKEFWEKEKAKKGFLLRLLFEGQVQSIYFTFIRNSLIWFYYWEVETDFFSILLIKSIYYCYCNLVFIRFDINENLYQNLIFVSKNWRIIFRDVFFIALFYIVETQLYYIVTGWSYKFFWF